MLPGSQSGGTYIEVSVDADDKKRGQKRKRISLATEEIMMYGKRRSARVRVLIVYLCHMLYLYITVHREHYLYKNNIVSFINFLRFKIMIYIKSEFVCRSIVQL